KLTAQSRRARRAQRAARGRAPSVLTFLQLLAAGDALVELRPEARPVQQMEIEPAAHESRWMARVEVPQRRFEQVEERCGRLVVEREAVGELSDVPARGDAHEIVAEAR